MKKSDFIGIGSQRCASTTLYRILSCHPELYLPQHKKELRFWCDNITKDKLNEYLNLFEGENIKNCLVGEITPNYSAMFKEEVAVLKKLFPEIKIILIIRNPVDRLISSITRGWTYSNVDKMASTSRNIFQLLKACDKQLSRRLTDYGRTYQIWSEYFSTDQIFIEKFETFQTNPRNVIISILHFLNVTPIMDDEAFSIKVNSSKPETKMEIPEILKLYLALEWLPKVKKMSTTLPVDLSDWTENLEAILQSHKLGFKFWLICIVHKVYFCMPYNLLYGLVKFCQIKIRFITTTRELGI